MSIMGLILHIHQNAPNFIEIGQLLTQIFSVSLKKVVKKFQLYQISIAP